ncbi:hypothetical protein HAX54_034089 [Datura stramonium]|uniref:Uncharacterized protein n=1 Tax=Datura stramonium TaxID=4076 RepID=A0ABS8VGK0_DATST|nr:hypothetical protein [Datura stramonium]
MDSIIDSKTNDLLPVESDAHLFEIVKDMKNDEFLNLYVVHVVNEAEVVEEDVGLANLLTVPEICENNNVSGGVRATNVGGINTDHEVEKDLGKTENLEDINLEVDEEFGEASEKVDVDIVDETEQYVEEHLDGIETGVENSFESEEEGIPEEDDSEVDEELRSAEIDRGFEDIGRNKAARYTGRLQGDEDYIDSSEADSDDSKDELDPEAVAGINLPGRRKITKLRDKLGLYVGRTICHRAKQIAMKDYMGDWSLKFARLCDYADQIKETNPGSSCWVRTDRESEPGKYLFVYFYVCFDALRRG